MYNVITSIGLQPFTIQVDKEDPITAFTASSELKRIQHHEEHGNKRLKLSTPYSLESTNKSCVHVENCSFDSSLNSIIQSSPYNFALAYDDYNEVKEEELEVLNAPWNRRPYMSMVVSQLLTGCIIADASQAILVNGVESYGQVYDVHKERDGY